MKVLLISKQDLNLLRDCQIKKRPNWPAYFGSNERGEVWPGTCFGTTPFDERRYCHDRFAVLQEVAREMEKVRPGCGRFFVDSRGAFYHFAKHGPETQFVMFETKSQIPTKVVVLNPKTGESN